MEEEQAFSIFKKSILALAKVPEELPINLFNICRLKTIKKGQYFINEGEYLNMSVLILMVSFGYIILIMMAMSAHRDFQPEVNLLFLIAPWFRNGYLFLTSLRSRTRIFFNLNMIGLWKW